MAESPSALLLWATAALALLVPVLSLLTSLIERSGPIRMRGWIEQVGGRLRNLYEDPARFAVFRYFLNLGAKLVPLALFVGLVKLGAHYGVARASAAAFVVVAAIVGATELASRRVLGADPERALRVLTAFYLAALTLLMPLVIVIAPFVHRHSEASPSPSPQEDAATEEEVEAFIDVGTQEGILEPEERDLVWGVVDFGETQVRSVMKPRVEMISAPVTASLDELVELFTSTGHSRVPLYRESADHIVGILHIRDLLRGLRSEPRPAAADLAQVPFYVPETKRLDELLRDLQRRRQQMAIVVDEYGGTAGLVTIEDLLEEIVGEIADEKDRDEPENQLLADGSLLLDGRADVETLEEHFGLAPGDGEYETVGGLISHVLGHVPRAGDRLDHAGLRFVVEKADARRILSVRVRRLDDAREVRA